MNLADIIWVGLAGSLGAGARFVIDGAVKARVRTRVPAGTVLVNLSGSLVLGVLTGLVVFHHAPTAVTLVGGAGVCGGLTTFSTASFETVRLVQRGDFAAATINTGVTVAGALAAAAVGMARASL